MAVCALQTERRENIIKAKMRKEVEMNLLVYNQKCFCMFGYFGLGSGIYGVDRLI